MKYYIDFDNTIFDTVSFYNDLLKLLYDNGITEEYISEYYNSNGMNPLRLINSINDVEIRNRALKHFDDTSKYVYQDAILFLRNNQNKTFILYSQGYIDYQSKKIDNSGILNYFDDKIISEEDKTNLDIDYQNGIFIDDNAKIINKLIDKKAYKIYRIKRKNNRHNSEIVDDKEVIEIFNMSEIKG